MITPKVVLVRSPALMSSAMPGAGHLVDDHLCQVVLQVPDLIIRLAHRALAHEPEGDSLQLPPLAHCNLILLPLEEQLSHSPELHMHCEAYPMYP